MLSAGAQSRGMAPALTVTIVLHNSAASLAECVLSIAQEVESGAVEIVAVDNDSPDSSAGILRELLPRARLLKAPRNLGFAAGCNLAWPHVRGRYWLLLNPDAEVPPGGLQTMILWMDAQPRLGVASPRLMGRDGTNQFAARRFPSIPLTLLELSRAHLALGQAARGRILLGPYAPGGADLSADWVPGTAMFLRREAVEDVGLFSETFFMYGEDVELCWRMRRRGWTVAVPTHVSFRHAGRLSAERTWGAAVTRARMLEGWYRACSDLKGSWYASCLLWLDWLAASVEASLPWRSARQRALAGQGADALWGLLRPSARRRAM